MVGDSPSADDAKADADAVQLETTAGFHTSSAMRHRLLVSGCGGGFGSCRRAP
jgi:hypothetical protein